VELSRQIEMRVYLRTNVGSFELPSPGSGTSDSLVDLSAGLAGHVSRQAAEGALALSDQMHRSLRGWG